jgi:hypothetical protein
LVTVDDEAQSVVHDEPVCEAFDTAARAGEQPEVRSVNAEAVDAHLDALRRRVEARRRRP